MQVGIYLGQKAAAAALVQPSRKGSNVVAEARQNLPDAFWQGDAKAIQTVFRELARAVGNKARRADVPCYIALPEHHIREERVQFTDVPASAAELGKLLDWRIARDYRLESGSFALAHQQGADIETGIEQIARIGPKTLIETISTAARKAGFMLSRVEGIGAYLDPAAPVDDTLSVSLFQTDAEAISVFTHASLKVAQIHREALDTELPTIAQTLARMTQANRIVTGAKTVSYTVTADPSLTQALQSRLGAEAAITHRERPDILELARLTAANTSQRATSFVQAPKPRPRLAALAMSLLGLASLAVIVVGVDRTGDIQSRTAKLEGHIASASAVDPMAANAPEIGQINELAARVTFYNALIGERHAELGPLLDALEQALPPQTWLRRLTYDVGRGTVSVQVASEDEANLAPALAAIEASDVLSSVILDRQIQVRSGQRVLSQYDISGVAK